MNMPFQLHLPELWVAMEFTQVCECVNLWGWGLSFRVYFP